MWLYPKLKSGVESVLNNPRYYTIFIEFYTFLRERVMKTLEFSLQGDFMCGRYTIFTDQQNDEMADILQQVQNQVKTDEIYPTNPAPVILADKVQAFYWGFLKFKSTGVIINARAETVAEKKSV